MTNWRIMGFGVLLLLIFLIIGLNAASAADDDSISNLTDNLETSAVSNSVDGVNSGLSSSETIGSVSESEFDSNEWTVLGEPDTTMIINKPATVELTCATIVNRIPDLIKSESGFIPTSRMGELKYNKK